MAVCHFRSTSFPSSWPHPVFESIEEQINRCTATQSICKKLSGLKDLYDCVDDLLQLPHTQQTLFHESESAEAALNESLRLLDVCGTTRDVLSQVKECSQELESSLRRRSGESKLTGEVDKYFLTRKSLNKMIQKCLKVLKKKEKRNTTISDQDSAISKIKKVEEASFEVFQSILSSVSYQTPKSTTHGWSVVSKLLRSKHISPESSIDGELLALKSSKSVDFVQVQSILKGLEAFESNIQELEEQMEYVYRRLLKARVSILNILNC